MSHQPPQQPAQADPASPCAGDDLLLPWQREMWRGYSLGPITAIDVLGGGMFAAPRHITTASGQYLLKGTVFRPTESAFAFQAALLDHVVETGAACPTVMHDEAGNIGRERDGRFWAIYTYQPGAILP